MLAFFSSFFLIAIAEVSDKSQLVVFSLAAKHKLLKVIFGIALGAMFCNLFSVLIGEQLSNILPVFVLKILTGLLFIIFGLWVLKGNSYERQKKKNNFRFGLIFSIAILFFLAELGDKTQFATISLAAKYTSFLSVWLGATLGMVLADTAAIITGVLLSKKMPEKLIKQVSALIFIFYGFMTLLEVVY